MEQRNFMLDKNDLIEGSSKKENYTKIKIVSCFNLSKVFQRNIFIHQNKSFWCKLTASEF